jgi:peptidoglycan glycosyltransferase
LIAWSLAATIALGALGAVRLAEAWAQVEEARAALLKGDARGTTPVFARYQGWPLIGPHAAAGLVLAQALAGAEMADAPWPSVPRDASFGPHLSLLLDLAWRDRRVPALRGLTRLAERTGHPLAGVYRAALALEGGELVQARERLRADPSPFASRGLGREIEAVLALHDQGAVTIVRDRRGRRVGHLDSSCRLVLADGADPAWVPPAVATALSSTAASPGLRLSLDLDLAHLAQSALAGRRGSVVLLDPRTGAVLAAVSDPRTAGAGGTPAFEEWREPASISKLITTAAALRAGLDPDTAIAQMTCTGSHRYQGGTLWCTHPAGRLHGLDQALALSCNIAFANLGVLVGRKRLLDELRRWGFDGGELGLGPAGRILTAAGSERQLADLSIGLEATDLTPLHAALLAAVIGNQGRMPEPFLLEAEQGPLGLEPRPFDHPPAHDVIDPAWLGVLSRAMQAVSTYGTAAGLAPEGFPVAMKTGTGATWHLGYHANHIGVGPWPHPRVAFCVRVTHEPSSGRVTRAARQVVAALLEGLAERPAYQIRR